MSPRLLGLLLVGVVAGCGGGAPETPDGYATYEAERAAFAYPPGWKATPSGDGAVVRPAGLAEDAPGPRIELQDFTLDQDFDDFVEQSNAVVDTLASDGERSDYDADPAGADESVAREVRVKGYRTVSVTARVGERVLSLSASARPQDELDIDGVIASLRLKP